MEEIELITAYFQDLFDGLYYSMNAVKNDYAFGWTVELNFENKTMLSLDYQNDDHTIEACNWIFNVANEQDMTNLKEIVTACSAQVDCRGCPFEEVYDLEIFPERRIQSQDSHQ